MPQSLLSLQFQHSLEIYFVINDNVKIYKIIILQIYFSF